VTQGSGDTSLPNDAGTYYLIFQQQVLARLTDGRAGQSRLVERIS
jgi:hypothetical protein